MRGGIDDFEHAVRCSCAFLRDGADRSEGAHFRRSDGDSADDAEQVAERVLALRDAPGDEAKQRGEREAAEDFEHGINTGALGQHLEEEARAFCKAALRARFLPAFESVGLDDTCGLETFGEQRGYLAGLLRRLLGALAYCVAERDDRAEGERIDHRDDQRELPVFPEQPDEHTDDGGKAFGEIVGKAKRGFSDGDDIADKARNEAAGGSARDARKVSVRQRVILDRLHTDETALHAGIVEQRHAIHRERACDGQADDCRNAGPDPAATGALPLAADLLLQ